MLKPYEFQAKIINRFQGKPHWALLMEAGTGKTLIAIYLMRYWFNVEKRILPTLIFCPPIVLENWKEEILQCSKIPAHSIGIVMGDLKKRLKIINDPKHKILILNYECMRAKEVLDALIARKSEVIIADESHYFKNPAPNTGKIIKYLIRRIKRGPLEEISAEEYGKLDLEERKKVKPVKRPSTTGAMLKLGQNARYKGIMSGTPVPKPEDIWSQFMFLDYGKTFGNRFRAFKNRFFNNVHQGWTAKKAYPKWVFIPSKEPEFQRLLASISVSMKKKDCLDLPDLVEKVIYVDPSPEMKKHYKNLMLELITYIEDHEDNPTVVQNALTKCLRLAEVLSGYLKLEDETIHSFKKNPTLEALMQILESTGDAKVIVFANFKQNYIDIAKRLDKEKIEYIEIHGQIPTKKKLENVKIFNDMSNNCKVAIVHPKSGGVGINLKSASYSVYYSIGYSLIDFEQSRARNYRSGSVDLHDKITHYFLCHKGLITEEILRSVKDKVAFADNLLDLKQLLKEML